ncbi:hypothetical protein BGZ81_004435, partial [Podila clonocystis]
MLSSKSTPGGSQTKDLTSLVDTPVVDAVQPLTALKKVIEPNSSSTHQLTGASGKIPILPALPTLAPIIASFNTPAISTTASTAANKTPAQIGRLHPAKELKGITINTSSINPPSSRPSSARKPVKYGPVSPRVSSSPIDSATAETSPRIPAPTKTLPHPPATQESSGYVGPQSNNPITAKKSQDSIVSSKNNDQDIVAPSSGATATQKTRHISAQSNVEAKRCVSAANSNTSNSKIRHNGDVGGIKSHAYGLRLTTPSHVNGISTPLNKGGMSSPNGTVISNGSSGNGSTSSTHQDEQSKGKLGFLGLKTPLLSIKKRGSDINIKDSMSAPSSPSLSSTASLKNGPLSSLSLNDNRGPCEQTSPKQGLLSAASFSPSKSSHRHVHINRLRSARQEHQDPFMGHQYQHHQYQPSRSSFQTTERESLPPHHYENEDFALWIRSVTQARQVVSGVDVDDQGEVMSSGSSTHSASTSGKSEKKKLCPELEDLAILEEILDFSLIILMRASASLYSYIYGAHSKMIKVYVPWQRLLPKNRPCNPVRNARDYQSIVMSDIGEAIEIMAEIYEQEARPFGHPDNQGRDTKQHFGPQYGTYVRPPGHLGRKSNTYGDSRHSNNTSSVEFKKGAMAQLLNTIGITSSNSSSGTQKYLSPTTLRAMAAEMTSSHSDNSHLSTPLPMHLQPHQRPAPIQTTLVPRQPHVQHQYPNEPRRHRRRSSVSIVKTSMASLGKNIVKSMPSPNILNSAPGSDRNTSASYSFMDKAAASSATSAQSMPVPTPARQSQPLPSMHSAIEAHSSFTSNSTHQSSSQSHQGSSNLSFPVSLQSIFGFKSPLNSTSQQSHNGHSLVVSDAAPFVSSPQLSTGPVLTRHEERQLKLEVNWRADITHRKAALRAWCCHRFTELYEFSLSTTCSLEGEFKDLYRIISSIVDVNRTDRSHEALAWELERTRSDELPFKLRYSQYRTVAPTSDEIDQANKTAAVVFQSIYDGIDDGHGLPANKAAAMSDAPSTHITTIPPTPRLYGPDVFNNHNRDEQQHQHYDNRILSAYENMEFYHLQEHPLWEPLLDRVTKFDSTHHALDPRNIFQFLRRMSVDNEPLELLTDATRNELLAVLWIIERCVCERPDFQQSPTWFRLSSSASAVQAVYRAGGVLAYLKELRVQNNGKDPILSVHPVTLTGYFKRLLKEAGGLLLKETTGLFVELVRPTTDNGDFWNLEQLSRIDRALLLRVICLDKYRGEVFIRISRVMAMILERAPEDMELDAFALSKMVQVVELSGVLDLKALKRWNGAWSAIILG